MNQITIALGTILISVIILIVLYVKRFYSYWKNKGIPYDKPSFPFGSLKDFFFGVKSDYSIVQEIYNKHPDSAYVGFYQGTCPALILRDPEVIKDVMVKSFRSLIGRGIGVSKNDPLAENLLFISGKKWKLLRQKLTPAFTSGKLKSMTPLISDCGVKLQEHLKNLIKRGHKIDVRTTIADYTTSVVTSCAFGIESKTLSEDDTPFREVGRNFFEQNPNISKAIMLDFICPSIFKLLSFSRLRSVDNLFIPIFRKVLRSRQETTVRRNDFVDICGDLKKEGVLKDPEAVGDYTLEVTDELLAAQAFFFFLAGHETSETTISFALYELAHSSEYLNKVHDEIDKLLDKHGTMNYECLEETVFLERVIKEALRKYPSIASLQRVTNEKYTLPDGCLTIDKGVRVIIPAFCLHRDENYFENPSKFNPDRFLDDSLENSFYYLPFGKGPRQCIGLRLAMLQVKAALFSILSCFTLETEEQYQPYLELKPIFLAVKPKHLDLKIVPRKK